MEKLMRKCLDSILAQTFQDYECLLIDDGSKDSSPAICDEYAAKDPRFKAYHKSNGGLSDARNYGIERAQGVYTIFFDPDDWVDADCLTDMYAKAVETDADMVMCDLYYNDPYSEKYSKQEPQALDHYSVLEEYVFWITCRSFFPIGFCRYVIFVDCLPPSIFSQFIVLTLLKGLPSTICISSITLFSSVSSILFSQMPSLRGNPL